MTKRGNKVGRNDPCTCGSGKKYKKCHGVSTSTSPNTTKSGKPFSVRKLEAHEIPREVLEGVAKSQGEQDHYVQQFGHARQPISLEFQGYRMVAVGNQLIYQPAEKAKFFTDILLTLLANTFGREWWDAELAKVPDERHPVFQWRAKAMTYQNKQPKNADGHYSAEMTGPMLAYYTFAYDLFVVRDNGRLDTRLLERLKHQDQFQGARHELFAEATCIRAGFTIEHEDESDGSTRHAEFNATHKATGEMISVEAKSKHRPGVLGRPGQREEIGNHSLPIGRLLNDAVAKNPPHPLVVFLDMNLPVGVSQPSLGSSTAPITS